MLRIISIGIILAFCSIALRATEGPPDVMAQVEIMTVREGVTRNEKFLFVRAGIRVERHEEHRSSIWTLVGRGQVELEEVFHDQRQIIEYTPTELEITGRAVSWEPLQFLVDPTLLTRCKTRGRRRALGRPAVRHACEENEIRYRINWLIELRLPALIDARRSEGRTRLRLLEVHPLSEAPWDLPDLEGYERFDFGDFGDRHDHNHPVVGQAPPADFRHEARTDATSRDQPGREDRRLTRNQLKVDPQHLIIPRYIHGVGVNRASPGQDRQ